MRAILLYSLYRSNATYTSIFESLAFVVINALFFVFISSVVVGPQNHTQQKVSFLITSGHLYKLVSHQQEQGITSFFHW